MKKRKDVEKKEKRSEEKNKSPKKNIKILVIRAIVLIVLILSFVGGYFIYQDIKFREPIKQEWGQKYYVYLKDEENAIPKESENAKLNFIEVKDKKEPVMVVKYEIKKEVYSNVYFIEDNKVNAIIYEQPTNIELLYNIEKNEYNYYFHIENEENYYYQPINVQINNTVENGDNKEVTPEITISKDDVLTGKTESGEEATLSKVDETFVKVDIEDEYTNLDDLSDKDIKDAVEESIDEYKEIDEIITEEVKEEIEQKITEVNSLKEEIGHLTDEELYKKLKGIWYDKKDGYAFSIDDYSPRGKKDGKYFVWGWFGSEAFIKDKIIEIKYNGNNVYEFIFKDGSCVVDITNIDKKSIKIEEYDHKYVGKDWDEAYDRIL